MANTDNSNENRFFNWAKPYFDFIGKGKIYSLVYVIMALFCLLFPMFVIFMVIRDGYLYNAGTGLIVAFMFSLLVVAFASWVGFQLWWNRKTAIKRFENADFIAIPVVSDIVQTSGECIGTFLGIVGVGVGIIMTIYFWGSGYTDYAFYGLVPKIKNIGPVMIIGGPIAGFIILIIHRLFAEFIRIMSVIANNTREIARNTRNRI